MLADVKKILPLTLIQRERVLPVPGRVVVRQGQKVTPTDVVAECVLSPKYVMLDVAEGLNVSPEKANSLIKRNVGEEVIEKDVLAGPIGMFQRVVRSPYSGQIKYRGDGKVLIEVGTSPFELQAGIDGVVDKIMPDRGVIIETQGALIQGVWGNGKIDFGILQNLMETPEDELIPGKIDVSMRGTIVLGGYCQDPRVLREAVDAPVKGLILGSMSASLVSLAKKVPYPIVVIDGFGKKALNARAYKLLSTTDKNRDISLNAQAYQPAKGINPEIVISLPAPEGVSPPLETDEFTVGQEVYMVNEPYTARIGTLERILPKPIRFSSGIQQNAAEVRLEDTNDLVTVPLANLNTLGKRTKQDYY